MQNTINMKIFSYKKVPIEQFTEHRLALICNMNTQYQEKYKKSTFKSKHIWTSKKKIKEFRKQSSLEFLSAFILLFFHSELYRPTQLIFIHRSEMNSLVCTLVVEGPVSGLVRWHHMLRHWGFHLQRQLCVYFTFCCFIDLWSNTLLIKILGCKNTFFH